MNSNLANRITKVLMQDKSVDPLRIIPMLKSDIKELLKEYGELTNQISVEIEESETGGYNIFIVANVTRFKFYGSVS